MGTEAIFIIETKRAGDELWTGFYSGSLLRGIHLTRDYRFHDAIAGGVHDPKHEGSSLYPARGLPADASDLCLASACMVSILKGRFVTHSTDPDSVVEDGPRVKILRRGIQYDYNRSGYIHTWLTLDEILQALEHAKIELDSLESTTKKLIDRMVWFSEAKFEVRLVAWFEA